MKQSLWFSNTLLVEVSLVQLTIKDVAISATDKAVDGISIFCPIVINILFSCKTIVTIHSRIKVKSL